LAAGVILPIYIKAQNAALVVRTQGDSIIFEPFELSPPNDRIMSTEGRLRRCFPGRAMAVPLDVFRDDGFQTTLVETIVKMSRHEDAQGMHVPTPALQVTPRLVYSSNVPL
jgi:hypothetical protein